MRFHLFIKKQGASQIGEAMAKFLRFFISVLIFGFLLGNSVNAQEFNNKDIDAIAESLANDLADPFEKLQLAVDIRSIFLWRQRISRYAPSVELEKNFKQVFPVFITTLFTKDLKGADKRLSSDLVNKMLQAYNKNQYDFLDFYSQYQKSVPYYSDKPISIIRKKIVQFAIVLNESGSEALKILMQLTGIWPFC